MVRGLNRLINRKYSERKNILKNLCRRGAVSGSHKPNPTRKHEKTGSGSVPPAV
jgi:hypothetical protein